MNAAGAAAADPIETDAVIIGAGPVGLFQAFQLGLLEIACHIVDALPQPGGQPVALYPDKPIYDIPAVPVCTGGSLTEGLLQQLKPFNPRFHLGQTVHQVEPQTDGRWLVATNRGTRFLTRTVFIAAGVGAFVPRPLKVDGMDRFEGTQLLYHPTALPVVTGQHVLVAGDSDEALAAALTLSTGGQAASVSLMHRRDVFQAEPERVQAMRDACQAGRLHLVIGQPAGIGTEGDRLTTLQVLGPDGSQTPLKVDRILAFLGLSPRLGPIAEWGLALERKQVVVDTATLATSAPGIFAVGDVVTYPGKKKLIVSGFHECVMAAYGAVPLVFPGKPVHLEYTTSSSRLHQLLGVAARGA